MNDWIVNLNANGDGTVFGAAIVPLDVLDDPHLSDGAVRLYAMLAAAANRQGARMPSREALGARMGVSVEVVDLRFVELQVAGLVTETAAT